MLNKFAVFIAIGIIGYFTYSAVSEPSSKIADKGKELPLITKRMVNPGFITPVNNASPVDRDPFEVDWDRYADLAGLAFTSEQISSSVVEVNNVKFAGELMGILTDTDGQKLALIGGEVYSVGSFIQQVDSNQLWQIYCIGEDYVAVTNGNAQTVIRMPSIEVDYNDIQANITDQQQMEVTK